MPSSESSVPAQCNAPMRSVPRIVEKIVMTTGVADTSRAPLATLVFARPPTKRY
jgi:hypothetical protein